MQNYVIKGTDLNVCNYLRPSEPNATTWNYIEEYETILFCMKSYEKPGKAYIALGLRHWSQCSTRTPTFIPA